MTIADQPPNSPDNYWLMAISDLTESIQLLLAAEKAPAHRDIFTNRALQRCEAARAHMQGQPYVPEAAPQHRNASGTPITA